MGQNDPFRRSSVKLISQIYISYFIMFQFVVRNMEG